MNSLSALSPEARLYTERPTLEQEVRAYEAKRTRKEILAKKRLKRDERKELEKLIGECEREEKAIQERQKHKHAAEERALATHSTTTLYGILAPTTVVISYLYTHDNLVDLASKYAASYAQTVSYASTHIGTAIMTLSILFTMYNQRTFFGNEKRKSEPVTESIRTYLRHPIYAGFRAISVGFFSSCPSLLTAAATCGLFYLTGKLARAEEDHLTIKFGKEYAAYMTRVPRRFSPF